VAFGTDAHEKPTVVGEVDPMKCLLPEGETQDGAEVMERETLKLRVALASVEPSCRCHGPVVLTSGLL
jgi:hypothetical protein